MKTTILYDNDAKHAELIAGWGFSCLVEHKEHRILFDTGWDGNILLMNSAKLHVSLKHIDAIVLSHQHHDHIGGLTQVLNQTGKTDVYLPSSFSNRLKSEISSKANVFEIREPNEIREGILSTGEIAATVNEQSLIVKTLKGGLLITGCAHPGLENILERARSLTKIYGVTGGFHGFDQYDALADISLIVPCHCTQHKQEMQKRYPRAYEDGFVGKTIEIKEECD